MSVAPCFRQTTLERVAAYRRRRRFLQRGPAMIEIARIEKSSDGYLVYLKGQDSAFYAVPALYPAWVVEGPCRRERKAS